MDDDVHSLGGLYSVDALDDLERQRFERHLGECEDCQREVAEFGETVGRVGASHAETPPASMRATVLAAVDRTPQVRITAAAISARPAVRRRWAVTASLAAASLLLIAGLGIALVRSRSDLKDVQAMNEALADPTAQTFNFTGTDGTSARLVNSTKTQHMFVLLGNLPGVAADRAYEVWMINDKGPQPMGVVRPGADGTASVVLTGHFEGFNSFGVTEEAAAGSDVPTTDLIVAGSLSA